MQAGSQLLDSEGFSFPQRKVWTEAGTNHAYFARVWGLPQESEPKRQPRVGSAEHLRKIIV